LPNRKINTILSALQLAINLYKPRGFNVTSVHADSEISPLRDQLLPIQLNVCSTKEHVPEIERSIRTVKERVRGSIHDLPFEVCPKLLIKELILNSMSWLNAFPSENGVSKVLSPREIITGKQTNFKTDCRVEFGTYCQIHQHNDKTNDDNSRSVDAIALGPTGNRQGTYNFLTLDTWEKVTRNNWTELPMPRQIIDIVNNKGRSNKQRPVPRHNNFTFEWRPSIPIDQDDMNTTNNELENETNDEVDDNNTTIDNENTNINIDRNENGDEDYDSDEDDDEDETETNEIPVVFERHDAAANDEELITEHTTTFLSTEEEEEEATEIVNNNLTNNIIDLTQDEQEPTGEIGACSDMKGEGALLTYIK
jgi:hypothetical protein